MKLMTSKSFRALLGSDRHKALVHLVRAYYQDGECHTTWEDLVDLHTGSERPFHQQSDDELVKLYEVILRDRGKDDEEDDECLGHLLGRDNEE